MSGFWMAVLSGIQKVTVPQLASDMQGISFLTRWTKIDWKSDYWTPKYQKHPNTRQISVCFKICPIYMFKKQYWILVQYLDAFFKYPSRLPFKFFFAFHGHLKGAYLCLAVKWVKTGVHGVKTLLGVKGWIYTMGKNIIMAVPNSDTKHSNLKN